jgi:hypothetical protein
MPKAPLFFHHFGIPIGDSVIYPSDIVQALVPLVAHRGRRRQVRELAALKQGEYQDS